MFDFKQSDVPPLLLIIDRRDDAVTPLLNQVCAIPELSLLSWISEIVDLIVAVDLPVDGARASRHSQQSRQSVGRSRNSSRTAGSCPLLRTRRVLRQGKNIGKNFARGYSSALS